MEGDRGVREVDPRFPDPAPKDPTGAYDPAVRLGVAGQDDRTSPKSYRASSRATIPLSSLCGPMSSGTITGSIRLTNCKNSVK